MKPLMSLASLKFLRAGLPFILAALVLATPLLAFEAEAQIRKIDAGHRTLVVFAGGQERTVRVARDARITDAAGKELPDGLMAKQLEGAAVTLTVEREGNEPVVHAIRLG